MLYNLSVESTSLLFVENTGRNCVTGSVSSEQIVFTYVLIDYVLALITINNVVIQDIC